MERKIKLFSLHLMLAIVFSAVSSLTLLFCIVVQNTENIGQWLVIGLAVLFWIGLVLEQLFLWRANSLRKKLESVGKSRKNRGMADGRPGIISFFQNRPGMVSDVLLVLSVLCLIVFMALQIGEDVVQFILITIIVLTFRLHCILNGRNFQYKNNLEKRKVLINEQKH